MTSVGLLIRPSLTTSQKTPDDNRWTIDKTEFDEFIAMKKDSAPGPIWCLLVCRESWFPVPF